MKIKQKSKQAKIIVTSKIVNALKYSTSFYLTKSAMIHFSCFKDALRKYTVGQQTNSSLSD